ncbi:MAG: helix-turn-helix domain-containing protein [Nitrososphaera sp.]
MNITEVASKVAERFGVLSNPYRTLILAFLLKKKKASWSEIKQFLEGHYGSVNPNTLQFHLRALIQANMVERSGSDEDIIYSLGQLPKEIQTTLSTEIIEKFETVGD